MESENLLRQAIDRFDALTAEQRELERKIHTTELAQSDLHVRAIRADNAVANARALGRGLADAERAVAATAAARDDARRDLVEATARRRGVADELEAARAALTRAHAAYLSAVVDDLGEGLRDDSKLRQRMGLLFAVCVLAADRLGGNIADNWSSVLGDVFAMPRPRDHDGLIAELARKYPLAVRRSAP